MAILTLYLRITAGAESSLSLQEVLDWPELSSSSSSSSGLSRLPASVLLHREQTWCRPTLAALQEKLRRSGGELKALPWGLRGGVAPPDSQRPGLLAAIGHLTTWLLSDLRWHARQGQADAVTVEEVCRLLQNLGVCLTEPQRFDPWMFFFDDLWTLLGRVHDYDGEAPYALQEIARRAAHFGQFAGALVPLNLSPLPGAPCGGADGGPT